MDKSFRRTKVTKILRGDEKFFSDEKFVRYINKNELEINEDQCIYVICFMGTLQQTGLNTNTGHTGHYAKEKKL